MISVSHCQAFRDAILVANAPVDRFSERERRLAALHPGREFFVLSATAGAVVGDDGPVRIRMEKPKPQQKDAA